MRSKVVTKNIIANLLSQIITILYGFIVPIIIINYFGSSVNGLISSITQFLAYISLLESGFGPVVTAALYKPISNNDNKTIACILKKSEKFFRSIAYIFIAYIVVLCFIYPTMVSNSFEWIYTVSLIIIIAASTFAEYFFGMTYKLFIQADQKSYIISFIRIITYILSIVVVVALAKIGASIHLIKLISGLVFILRPIMQNYYVKKIYKINIKEADSNYKLEQKWDGLAQHIASVIHGNTDITILTIFTNLSEVSVYSIYHLVVTGLKSVIISFSTGIEATFGDMIAKKELNNLNENFSMYEVLYNTINTIVFSSTIILIVPFISVYTEGINDTNYIRPLFGTLIVISEYICMIRLPYISLSYAAGHFKETKNGAWVECATNLLISIILVWRYGIIGVTIGTIVAMLIRTVEFIYHSNKYILKRSMFESIIKIVLLIIETMLIVYISLYIPYFDNLNYLYWIFNAIITVIVASSITVALNCIFFNNEIHKLINIIKRITKGGNHCGNSFICKKNK